MIARRIGEVEEKWKKMRKKSKGGGKVWRDNNNKKTFLPLPLIIYFQVLTFREMFTCKYLFKIIYVLIIASQQN